MPRLIDELRSPKTKIAMPPFVAPERAEFWMQTIDDLRKLLMTYHMPIIVADNVADYFVQSVQNGNYHWNWEAYPNLAPPYHLFWIEYRTGTIRVGVLIMDSDAARVLLSETVDRKVLEQSGDAHWILFCIAFVDFGHGDGPTGPHAEILRLNNTGQVMSIQQLIGFSAYSSQDDIDPDEKKYCIVICPAWITICFMHCKNIIIKDNTVDKPLARKYKTRYGVIPTDYKTLVIEPLKSILKREGRSDEVGLMKAMHICRGHFSDYRQGHGLFGKHHQVVWMPDMIRGTKGRTPKTPRVEVLAPKIGF